MTSQWQSGLVVEWWHTESTEGVTVTRVNDCSHQSHLSVTRGDSHCQTLLPQHSYTSTWSQQFEFFPWYKTGNFAYRKTAVLYILVWQQIYQLKSTYHDAFPLIHWSNITWSFVCSHVLFYNTFLPFDINVTGPITIRIPLMLSITLKLYI